MLDRIVPAELLESYAVSVSAEQHGLGAEQSSEGYTEVEHLATFLDQLPEMEVLPIMRTTRGHDQSGQGTGQGESRQSILQISMIGHG